MRITNAKIQLHAVGRKLTQQLLREVQQLSGNLLSFVVGDCLLQVAVLVAGEKAQLVEYREVLLRLGEIADHQVGLAEIFVRAPVIGIDAQRLVVMLEDEAHVGVRTLADRVGVEIVVVGVVGISCKRLTQGRLRLAPVILRLGGGDLLEHRVARCTGHGGCFGGEPYSWQRDQRYDQGTMQRLHVCSLFVAVVMLTAAATHAFPAPPKSRGEALAGLRSPSEATRAEAVNWIASRGAIADAPLLHERLRDDSETVREFAEQGLWLLWGRSGDDEIDRRMARGTGEMQAGRLADSVATFSEIIRRRPDFAEVLKRNPQHFGALSGLGQIYFKLENYERSLAWFRRALEVNPNMLGVEINIEGIEELLEEKRRRSI